MYYRVDRGKAGEAAGGGQKTNGEHQNGGAGPDGRAGGCHSVFFLCLSMEECQLSSNLLSLTAGQYVMESNVLEDLLQTA